MSKNTECVCPSICTSACVCVYAHRREYGNKAQPISKQTWCLTSTETIRLIKDGEMGGLEYGGGWIERIYTYRYTVTTRMTSALGWAAMRAILMFRNCEGKSHKHKQCPQTTTFLKRKESRSRFEPRSRCFSTSLTPYR